MRRIRPFAWSAFALRASARQPSRDTCSLACLAEARPEDERRLERETGIEPATNSLEGCDSTTELLPPVRQLLPLTAPAGTPARRPPAVPFAIASRRSLSSVHRRRASSPPAPVRAVADSFAEARRRATRKAGGEGRTRTFEAAGATDLQSVAFDRFATSPISTGGRAGANALFFFALSRMYSGFAPCATTVPSLVSLVCARVSLVARVSPSAGNLELAKGFEPPTG